MSQLSDAGKLHRAGASGRQCWSTCLSLDLLSAHQHAQKLHLHVELTSEGAERWLEFQQL